MSQNKIYNLKDNVKIKKKLFEKILLEIFCVNFTNNSKIISTTGYTSRELFQIRNQKIKNKIMDFIWSEEWGIFYGILRLFN